MHQVSLSNRTSSLPRGEAGRGVGVTGTRREINGEHKSSGVAAACVHHNSAQTSSLSPTSLPVRTHAHAPAHTHTQRRKLSGLASFAALSLCVYARAPSYGRHPEELLQTSFGCLKSSGVFRSFFPPIRSSLCFVTLGNSFYGS